MAVWPGRSNGSKTQLYVRPSQVLWDSGSTMTSLILPAWTLEVPRLVRAVHQDCGIRIGFPMYVQLVRYGGEC